jgi:hypothetical protein
MPRYFGAARAPSEGPGSLLGLEFIHEPMPLICGSFHTLMGSLQSLPGGLGEGMLQHMRLGDDCER